MNQKTSSKKKSKTRKRGTKNSTSQKEKNNSVPDKKQKNTDINTLLEKRVIEFILELFNGTLPPTDKIEPSTELV